MADPRFYERLGPLTLADAAALCGASLHASADAAARISGVAAAGAPEPESLSYAENAGLIGAGVRVPAGCVFIVKPQMAEAAAAAGAQVMMSPAPRAAFARLAARLVRERALQTDPPVSSEARIGDGARIYPGAMIGEGAEIGAGASIGPGAVIGPGVIIGAGAEIGPGASIACALLDDGVRIGAGAAVGQAGFGVALGPDGPVDVPHFGRVRIGRGARIGAHCAIDRGLFADTVIGAECKIDNFGHIAHNVTLGDGCVFAAFAGVSGSVTIGRGVIFGGRVGVADHVAIGDGAQLGGGAEVFSDVPAGAVWSGSPAQPVRDHLRQVAALRRLAKGGTRREGRE